MEILPSVTPKPQKMVSKLVPMFTKALTLWKYSRAFSKNWAGSRGRKEESAEREYENQKVFSTL